MRIKDAVNRMFASAVRRRRMSRRVNPAVRALERRQLLSGPTATMTQTAAFPNLEALPNVATQAFLYFSSTMGTLTEVDVVTSGTFSTEFAAENLTSSSKLITGTTTANLSINVPSGAIPLSIPSVTDTFNASPFDGTLDYGGTSGKDFAAVTSGSATQTTVLTSPAALAAFTGNFRIPITVSGHANGSATPTNGGIADSFHTQTSATITVVYHYDPSLPSLNPTTPTPSGSDSAGGQGTGSGSVSGSGTGTTAGTGSATGSSSSTASSSASSSVPIMQVASKSHVKKKAVKVVKKPAHKAAKAAKVHERAGKVKTHHA
jgi:hypothetical protein